jgi:hypothetical protein
MISMEKRKCLNRECPNGGFFIPARANQLHCPGCKDRKGNLKKKQERDTIFIKEKVLKHNARRLAYIYRVYVHGDVPSEILKYEKIEKSIFTDISKNPRTGGNVYWSHNYGLELVVDSPSNLFRVHKR